MSKYNTFLAVFIISIAALIVFLVFYLDVIFTLVRNAHELGHADPFELLATIFSPAVMISGLAMAISNLLYRVLGIIHVAKNKTISGGEKALWVIGFIIMGFVTAIVFLVLAKGRNMVE